MSLHTKLPPSCSTKRPWFRLVPKIFDWLLRVLISAISPAHITELGAGAGSRSSTSVTTTSCAAIITGELENMQQKKQTVRFINLNIIKELI